MHPGRNRPPPGRNRPQDEIDLTPRTKSTYNEEVIDIEVIDEEVYTSDSKESSKCDFPELPKGLSNPKKKTWLATTFYRGEGYENAPKGNPLYKFFAFWEKWKEHTSDFSDKAKRKAATGNIHEAAAKWWMLSNKQKVDAAANLKHFAHQKKNEGYGWPHAARYLDIAVFSAVDTSQEVLDADGKEVKRLSADALKKVA